MTQSYLDRIAAKTGDLSKFSKNVCEFMGSTMIRSEKPWAEEAIGIT